jgi:hypothetical protein
VPFTASTSVPSVPLRTSSPTGAAIASCRVLRRGVNGSRETVSGRRTPELGSEHQAGERTLWSFAWSPSLCR